MTIPPIENAMPEIESPEIADKMEEFQQEQIDVNFLKNEVVCKKCSFLPAFTVRAITDHIKMHKYLETKSSDFMHRERSLSELSFEETNDCNISEKGYITKTLMEYLRNIFFLKEIDEFWINRKMCINKHSFVGLYPSNGDFVCLVCDDVFPSYIDQAHCQTDEHKQKLLVTKVITSLNGELVRELQPHLFHCGFCNMIATSYGGMNKHLKSTEHHYIREHHEATASATEARYSEYLPDTVSIERDLKMLHMIGNRLF